MEPWEEWEKRLTRCAVGSTFWGRSAYPRRPGAGAGAGLGSTVYSPGVNNIFSFIKSSVLNKNEFCEGLLRVCGFLEFSIFSDSASPSSMSGYGTTIYAECIAGLEKSMGNQGRSAASGPPKAPRVLGV
ncbi:uncharacterized protein CLUP02_02840 [Colletotrichum lupini]|uniref:Uncharacterized protein n=1 Tax=Colletotrichum lupini TaxID=145971 RepID=A0A9Q8SJ09_9PEZI|nr:uncharacterized protein CLUP02_02840 [Colletotrichum lupini]UQC77372.1 hypothetical protein CLUP02_02840 [Colletotrichum lupini]